jgi:hypothetical protein
VAAVSNFEFMVDSFDVDRICILMYYVLSQKKMKTAAVGDIFIVASIKRPDFSII